MWKRLIGAVILLVVLAAAYWLVRSQYRLPFDRLSLYEAVPQNSAALLRLSSLSPDSTASNIVPLWSMEAKHVVELLHELGLSESVEWGSWWLLPVQGDGPFAATYTLIGMATGGLSQAWNPTVYGPELASSEGEVYTHKPSAESPLYFGRHHNLFVAGKFAFQVESVLSAAQGSIPSWQDDPAFVNLRAAFQGLDNSRNSQLILKLGSVESSLPTNWHVPEQLRFWQSYADWLFLDFEEQDHGCKVTSYSTSSTQDLLPNTTSDAWHWVPEISDGALPVSIAAAPEEDVQDAKKTWIGNGAWMITLPNVQLTRPQGELWVLPIGDTSSYTTFRQLYLHSDQLMDQRTYQLYEMRQLQSAEGFDFLTDRRRWQPWFVELPEGLLVSVFREDLERYLDYHLVGGMLDQQEFFLNLKADLPDLDNPTQQGFLRWGPLKDGEANLLNLLFPGENWAREGAAVFVSQQTKEKVNKTILRIADVPARSLPATIRWTLPLASNEELQLFPVKELGTENTNYFLIQSADGQCWLIDIEGTIWWEKQGLPGLLPPVWHWREEGGARRWGATSQQGLYVWDEQGQSVPLPLISSAPSSGLSVFTFDARGTPVLAYPNQNQQLELRSTDGTPLPGWPAPLSGRSNATFPLVHWQTEVEDLIIAWTSTEAWQIFNREGRYQSSLPNVPEPLLGAPAYDFYPLEPEQSRLLGATATGKVNVWNLAGDIVPIPLGRGPLDRWLFQNAWGDNRPDYVAQRGSLVHLFGFENNKFAERWQQRFSSRPDTIIAAPPMGIIVLSEQEQKVWLIDTQGQISTTFPLAGSGGAHLVKTNDTHCTLVTLLNGKVYAYDLVIDNS